MDDFSRFGLVQPPSILEVQPQYMGIPARVLPIKDQNLADEFCERLSAWISSFSDSLDEEHEVGVRLVSFGNEVVFHLEAIDYWNPSLMKFLGKTDQGQPVELIQHVSQISILLMKLPRLQPDKPKPKIGFTNHTEEAS